MARRVAVPDRVREMGLLDRIDYGDAFVGDAPPAGCTPERCAELAMGTAPAWVRAVIRVAHRRVLGLRLVPQGPDGPPVPGWQRLRADPGEVVYGVDGGMVTPRVVLTTTADGRAVMSTLLRYDRPGAGAVWAVVGPVHRLVSRLLLDRGVRLARATTEGADT